MSNTKEKIIDSLEGIKEYEVTWIELITYSRVIKSKSEKEVEEMFNDGEISGKDKDVIDVDYYEDSLRIYEA